jgi:hypothetical protein
MNRTVSLSPLTLAVATLLSLPGCDRQSDEAVARTPETEKPSEAPDDQPASRDAESEDSGEEESAEGAATGRPGPKVETDEPDPHEKEHDVTAARRDHTRRLWVGGLSEQDGEIRVAVDVRELGIFEFGGLEDLMGMRTAGPAPYETGALPEPFDELERVDVLTPEGVVELAIERVRPHSYGPRASDKTFWLRTEASEKLDGDFGQYTLIAPAGTMDDEATFRTVDGRPPNEQIVSTLRDAVLEQLDDDQLDQLEHDFPPKGIEPEQEQRLEAGESLAEVLGESREFRREHFTVVEGDFPAPHDLFVAVNGPEGNGGAHNQRFPIVRMSLLVREDGTVTDVPYRGFGPSHTMGHPTRATIKPMAVADPDGDGTEGLLVRQDDEVYWLDFETD